MDRRERQMHGIPPARSGRRSDRSRTVRGLGALLGISALLPGCMLPLGEDGPNEPAPVGRPVAEVHVIEDEDRQTLEQLRQVTPKGFADAEDFEHWRAQVSEELARGEGDPPEGLEPLDVDDATEVVVADVYDACDADQVFVAAEPSVVVSHVYDPSPGEEHDCAAPAMVLVVSVVQLEEIGASSPEDVIVR